MDDHTRDPTVGPVADDPTGRRAGTRRLTEPSSTGVARSPSRSRGPEIRPRERSFERPRRVSGGRTDDR
ncbi:hypothetical protein [Haloarcula nitratireducens]|uniref:Uncharacterized protein n=1 Tax=Haloarcula nitratireducens TaxID=2487749 RepID=A0AAW4P8Y0_9EURY|nr:hypothetical protein [Halomicroarcula nitratireducens]MBX0294375.1 hypothetical protein [Halomicroarcula nitratireducens]